MQKHMIARPRTINPYRLRRRAWRSAQVLGVVLALSVAVIAIAMLLTSCALFVDVCGTLASGGYLHAESVDANGSPASFMLFSRSGDLIATGISASAVQQCHR